MVCFVALGNELRSDDAVGLYAGRRLKQLGFNVLFAYTDPSSVLSKIPDGEVYFIDAAEFDGNESFSIGKPKRFRLSTHSFSTDLIEKFLSREIQVIGIRTYNHDFGEAISAKAKKNADEVIKYIKGRF